MCFPQLSHWWGNYIFIPNLTRRYCHLAILSFIFCQLNFHLWLLQHFSNTSYLQRWSYFLFYKENWRTQAWTFSTITHQKQPSPILFFISIDEVNVNPSNPHLFLFWEFASSLPTLYISFSYWLFHINLFVFPMIEGNRGKRTPLFMLLTINTTLFLSFLSHNSWQSRLYLL